MSVLRLGRRKKDNVGVVGKWAVFKLLYCNLSEPEGFVFAHSVCCFTAAGQRAGPVGSGGQAGVHTPPPPCCPLPPGSARTRTCRSACPPTGQETISLF